MIRIVRQKSIENKKIKGSEKNFYDGIHFRSQLEMKAYLILKQKFKVNYEAEKWQILEKFVYNDRKINGVSYQADLFIYLKNLTIVVEMKGFPNDAWRNVHKLVLRYLVSKPNIHYYVLTNLSEVKSLVDNIEIDKIGIAKCNYIQPVKIRKKRLVKRK